MATTQSVAVLLAEKAGGTVGAIGERTVVRAGGETFWLPPGSEWIKGGSVTCCGESIPAASFMGALGEIPGAPRPSEYAPEYGAWYDANRVRVGAAWARAKNTVWEAAFTASQAAKRAAEADARSADAVAAAERRREHAESSRRSRED